MPALHAPGSWRIRFALLLGATLLVVVPLQGRAWAATAQPTWSTLSPPGSPPALRGAAAAYDAANQTVVVFGGELPDGALSDQTWVWDGTTWSRRDQGYGSIPAARKGASMAYDADLNQLILFGGEGPGHTLLDDTWLWNGASWIEVTAPSTPGARVGAAFAADPDGRLVLFGGYGVSNAPATAPPPSSTTSTSTSTSTTTTTTTSVPSSSSSTTTSVPASASGTSGGASASSSSTTAPASTVAGNRAHTTSTAGATTPATAAAASRGGRSAATGAGVTGQGGERNASSSGTPAVLGDTWLLESTSQGDNWVPATTPVHPAAVRGAVAVSAGDHTLLFGGRGTGTGGRAQLSNRTWAWSGQTWSLLRTPTAPPPRSSAVVVDDGALGGIVTFGGRGAHGALGDVWILQGDRWQRLATAHPPAARSRAVGVYDAASRQVVVFGGAAASGRALHDTVVLAAHPPVAADTSPSTTTTTTSAAGGGSPTTRTHHHGQGGSTSTPGSAPPTTAPGRGHGSGGADRGATGGRHPRTAHIHPGDVVTLEGHGFKPGARVVVTFEPTHQVVAVTRANADGRFRVEVTVPDGASDGAHDFRATGSGPHGPVALVTPVHVAAYTTSAAVSPATTASLVALAVAVPLLTLLGLQLAGRVRRTAASS